MINEAIFGGLISALSRGESLKDAMFTFYNAGYGKQEIEDAARELHKQTGGQAEKMINPQKISEKDKAVFQPATKQESKPISQIPGKFPSQLPNKQEAPGKKEIKKPLDIFNKNKGLRPVQIISKYGESDKAAEELTKRIETAIHSLKDIKLPSKVEVIHGQVEQKSPVIIQRISDYGEPPKPISKAVTLLLIFILILLIGALAAVFFFKEQLIAIFNKANLV